MERDVVGGGGVSMLVTYAGTQQQATGSANGKPSRWGLSNPVQIRSNTLQGGVPVQFSFVSNGHGTEQQIYDFYVDPRLSR
jgi:hypothetical protein